MAEERELPDLLGEDGARVIAFDPLGSGSMPLPHRLADGRAEELCVQAPLDLFAGPSQGAAVAAYERARRHGSGSAVVRILDEDQRCQLDIFDLEASDGCFVGVLTPATAATVARPTTFAPRRSGFTMNATGVVETIDSEFELMFGWTAAETVGLSSLDLIHPDDHEAGIVAWADVLETPEATTRIRQRFKHRSGEWIWCEVTDINRLDDPGAECISAEVVDVSREIAAEQSLQRRETLLERLSQALPTGILHLDAHGNAAVWNDRWSELTGIDGSAGTDGLAAQLDEPDRFQEALIDAVLHRNDMDLPVALSGTGSCRFGELHIRPLDEAGVSFGVLITLEDVTRLRSHQLELADQTRRDTLTGCYNRFGIEEFLQGALSVSSPTAVLYLDLDDFKRINDDFGHHVGDEVLRTVAATVGEIVRPQDALGRWGGDEFLVVLADVDSEAVAIATAERVEIAGGLVSAQFPEGVSIGIAVGHALTAPGDDVTSLLRRADAAMYARKRQRRESQNASRATSPERS